MNMLPARIVAKPWGRLELPAPFLNSANEPIGEIWFEPPRELDDLLVKYIFTSENLSVQCHPSDQQTQMQGFGRKGKEECWLVLDAEPGARLGIGFDAPIDADTIQRAALDGSIKELLTWHPVAPGDFFYIPANTVHAIGAGISLIEVQQNSDITYRLYDYGRPRELHLDQGIAIARGDPYPAQYRQHVPASGHVRLVDGPLFRLDRLDGPPGPEVCKSYSADYALVIPVDCTVRTKSLSVSPGQCAVTSDIDAIEFPEHGHCLIAQCC